MTQKSYIQLENYVKGPTEYLFCDVNMPCRKNCSFLVLELKDGTQ